MSDLQKKLSEIQHRHSAAHNKVAAAARMVLPVLKDHNLNHSAESLSVALFELDAVEGEMVELARGNLEEIVDMMTRRGPEKP